MEEPATKRRRTAVGNALALIGDVKKGAEALAGLGDAMETEDLEGIILGQQLEAAFLRVLIQYCKGFSNSNLTQFSRAALVALIRYCEQLRERSSDQNLWQSYNLVLTAVVANMFGLDSHHLLTLRKLTSHMSLQQIVECSSQDLGAEDDDHEFIRSGLAVQAWMDYRGGASLGEVHLANVIVVAQGLVQGPCNFLKEWLLFLEKASEGCDPHESKRGSEGANLEKFKTGACAAIVVKPLSMVVSLFHGEVKNHALTVWVRILCSMPFHEFVKVIRSLLSTTQSMIELRDLLNTVRSHVPAMLEKGVDDPEAVVEIRELLRDVYKCGELFLEQTEGEDSWIRVELVLDAVRLYVAIVIDFGRGGFKHKEIVLDAGEAEAARCWLLRLQEQSASARVKSFLNQQYNYVNQALKMALLLNTSPSEYPYGVPM